MKKPAGSKKAIIKTPKSLMVVIRTLDEKKAEDLRILDVRAQSSITDYLVLATGTSGPHLRALRSELEKALDGANVSIVGVESAEGSGWTVFDAFEVMVHLFTPDTRSKYRLELLWKDAISVPLDDLLAKPVTAKHERRRLAARRQSNQ